MSQLRQDHEEIKRVATNKETIEKALEILQQARYKTGQGSGFDLSKVSNGMAIACALIASEILRNGDVDASNAQKASCLQPNHFKHCYETIRKALSLDSEGSSRRGRPNESTWRRLGTLHPTSKDWSKFESYLEQCRNTFKIAVAERSSRYDKVDVECAIFCWVYEIVEENQLDIETLAKQSEAKERTVNKICKFLDERCQSLRAKIDQDAKSKPKFVLPNPTTPRRSPNKRPLRELPTRDSPKKPKVSHEVDTSNKEVEEDSRQVRRGSVASPSKVPLPSSSTTSPIKSPTKRVHVEIPTVSVKRQSASPWITRDDSTSDVEMAPPDTPSKPSRRTRASPTKPAPTAGSSRAIPDTLRTRTVDTVSPARKSGPQTRAPSPTPTPRHSPRKSRVVSTAPEPVKTSSPPKKLRQVNNSRAASEKMLVGDDGDASSEDEEDELPEPVQKRFRPVFHDHRQWERGDPRVDDIYRQAELSRQKRVEVYGLPFNGKYQPQPRAQAV
ncbi:hypothetical protein K435DRAFT_972546 [Dendrothele bispora CBS 962.96]|uniref:Uncharacterized protein n=1 Tax=Dendrothele bispora (strain CBS 962.96) TaxID=1314807 RepID=A0A4S8KY43_DENBC|nr:hypothetical protein K435DRAFT_972546 [Dendrothele bispora CBS 962.96]